MRISVTIDVEFDWGSRIKSDYAIAHTIDKILEIFAQKSARGTFFISTEILPSNKEHIQKIVDAGHKIASHGHHHTLDYDQKSKEELFNEIERSKKILEDSFGVEIVGFRTPAFKRNRYTDEVLETLGFLYDSSTTQTALKGRYKPMQYAASKKLRYFSISSLYERFPAGIKWINLLGFHLSGEEPYIIYAHPFDFLSIKETLALYDKNKIPLHVLAFYCARLGSLYQTLRKVVSSSTPIESWL